MIYSDYLNPTHDDFILFNGSENYKVNELKKIMKHFSDNPIRIGIGDKYNDASAYFKAGIPFIFILDDDSERENKMFPSTTQFVDD